jgi:hypothetical protein
MRSVKTMPSTLPHVSVAEVSQQEELGQYMTPDWAAEALVEQYFSELGGSDCVWEPSCGRGAFLRAIPEHVPAFGVEIDPAMADIARRSSGRPVIVGDFRTVDLPVRPTEITAVIGNPPFKQSTVLSLLERAHAMLPDDGRVGLVLPCFLFQTGKVVVDISSRWSIRQDMLPRNLFPGLSHPLCFAVLTKGVSGKLFNFALYHELVAVQQLQRRYRELLAGGEKSVWNAVTIAALENLGGRASLQDIYDEIEGNRPTKNEWWRAKVRQTLQRVALRIGPAEWALPGQWSEPFQPSLLGAA